MIPEIWHTWHFLTGEVLPIQNHRFYFSMLIDNHNGNVPIQEMFQNFWKSTSHRKLYTFTKNITKFSLLLNSNDLICIIFSIMVLYTEY